MIVFGMMQNVIIIFISDLWIYYFLVKFLFMYEFTCSQWKRWVYDNDFRDRMEAGKVKLQK